MNIKFYLRLIVFTLLGLVNAQWAAAQNVTISPQTGNLIAALTGNYSGGTTEVGFQHGWSAMWRHEQLPLTLTVADQGTLTPGGELDYPAGNINEYGDNLVVMGGEAADLYMEVSLPKGYRFTGYKIVMLNNLNGQTVNDMQISNSVTKTMYETHSDFDINNSLSHSQSMGTSNSNTTEYTIDRTSNTDTDMGHQLYFRMHRSTDAFFFFFFKRFEIYFSAEGGFTETVAPVSPVAIQDGAVSYVEIPYATSKLDIGEIKPNTKNGATYYSYDYRNVKDLTANLYLFQDDAVDTDGNAADVAPDNNKNIRTVYNDGNLYYGLKNDIYYIETPITATDQNNSQLLVGYRITDATINYFWGNKAEATTVRQETTETKTETRDTYKVSRNNNYYLDSFGGLTTDRSSQAEWFIDGDGYLRLVSNPNAYITYYSSGNIYLVTTTTKRSNAVKVRYQSNNLQAYIDNSWRTLRYYEYTDGYGWYATTYRYFIFTTSNTSNWNGVYSVSCATGSKSIDVEYPTTVDVNVPAFAPKPYTIKFYDMNGDYLEGKDVEVNGQSGSVKLSTLLEEGDKFNNDAVKFQIADCADQALITVDVTMEALDPYIQSIDIVCHDYDYQDELTQTFTANDFAVRGGKFTFYVPRDFSSLEGVQKPCKFTFEDLYSKYGDNTYYTGDPRQTDGNARYVFVESPYDSQFTSLYATNYNPDATYNNPSKVQAIKSGKVKFRFNNADELGNTSTSTETKHLEEYAFNKTEYGLENFAEFFLTAGTNSETNHGIRYLFTADETRYNISPATATEHRMYAYYVMDIELVVKEYSPTYQWKEVYSETLYSDSKGKPVTKPYYGLVLGTTESNEGHMGYLTADQINQVLTGAKQSASSDGQGAYDYTVDRPSGLKGTDQVLYVDGSDLLGIVYRKTTEEENVDELDQIRNMLADNALIYLPKDLSPAKDNFASKTESGGFNACKDVVLTDQRPFFAPRAIQVSGANIAEYKRTLTPAYGTDISTATVVLPFTIDITNGKHTNQDGTGSFELYQLDSSNCLSTGNDVDLNQNTDYSAKAHFVLVSGSNTVANKPYMVKVTSASGESKVPFIVHAIGAKIEATPTSLTGESGSGAIGSESYSFQNVGTFSGVTLKQTETKNIFYFAKNALYNIQSLEANLDLYIQPFRAYYSYTSPSPAKANLLEIVFGANDNPFSETTGITSAESQPDLAVTSGHGTITIASKENNTVNISALNGMQAGRVILKAGETKTVNVPAGLYVVNGVKIVVK